MNLQDPIQDFPTNLVLLSGEVASAPEIRYLAYETPTARFRLRTRELIPLYDGSGEREQELWHRVFVRGELAAWVESSLREGDRIQLRGRLASYLQTDRLGNREFVTEISASDIRLLPRAAKSEATQANPSPSHSDELPWEDFSPSPDEDPFA